MKLDTLYIGDEIPSDYHYAVFNSYYVDLYNTPNPRNYVTRYRIFLNYNHFAYQKDDITVNTSLTTYDIPVSSDLVYRRDFGDICTTSFIIIFSLMLLFNVVTSVFKKGGLFSGLI